VFVSLSDVIAGYLFKRVLDILLRVVHYLLDELFKHLKTFQQLLVDLLIKDWF
jgi:hypothetical protein